MTAPLSAQSLLRRPVLVRGIRIGRPVDLVLDVTRMHALGLEVRCGDEEERFLPFPAARLGEEAIVLDSALQLLDERDLAFYRRRATSFRALRGLPVERDGHALGTLADVVLRADGAVVEVAVGRDGERRRVALDGAVSIGGRRVAYAA